jgi:hypothetical protein
MRTNDEETITRLQNQINRLVYSNQVNAVKNEKNGSKKWWSKVNSMTGRKGNTLPVSSIIYRAECKRRRKFIFHSGSCYC